MGATGDHGGARKLGPHRLAAIAVARPRRVLAAWAVAFVVAILLTGALLPSALNSETATTNNPESEQAKTLIDERLHTGPASEVIVVRNEDATVADPAFRTTVQQLAAAAKATGAVRAL